MKKKKSNLFFLCLSQTFVNITFVTQLELVIIIVLEIEYSMSNDGVGCSPSSPAGGGTEPLSWPPTANKPHRKDKEAQKRRSSSNKHNRTVFTDPTILTGNGEYLKYVSSWFIVPGRPHVDVSRLVCGESWFRAPACSPPSPSWCCLLRH